MNESGITVAEPACAGLAKAEPPDPCVLVIFGASGDLAHRKLFPALYALHQEGLLPNPVAIVGFSRGEWDDNGFREDMLAAIKKSRAVETDQGQGFAASLGFVPGDFTSPPDKDYAALSKKIEQVRADKHIRDNILFHLSTPPQFYGDIVERLSAAGLLNSDHGWRRVAIEKPFGRDEQSVRQLDRRLAAVVREEQLYRVDHYLGKETVQNMLVFRFANPGFEPIWNRDHIDHVQITAAESLGIGTRGGYYDKTGVVRDMVQNHLLQLLCMTAMDAPVSYDGFSVRNETFKVLQAIRPPDLNRDCVLGQYGPGEIDGAPAAGYRAEQDVAKDSTTPTYAALRLSVDNWRWAGVPFYLRTGKRLPGKVTEITLAFKPTPHWMFAKNGSERLQNNTLTFRLQPEEGIFHKFLAKHPGPDLCLRQVMMRFRYDRAFAIDELPGAYEWLLLEALRGDQTLFARSDWIYKAWSLVDPLIRAGETGSKELPNYAAGSWGPGAADALLQRDGHAWSVV